MEFLSPLTAAIAAGITVPALVSLYFLKLKRKRLAIPSTLLWQKAVQDMQVNAPFQRIRNNLLLWVQLLLLLALLIAMARPTKNAFAQPGTRVVIVIDHSASMNSKDAADGKTRLEAAKARALEIVDSLDAGGGEADREGDAGSAGGAMVIAYAHRAVVLQDFTTDLARVRRAIRQIEPTDQASHLDSALASVEPYARQGSGGDPLFVHILSDGKVKASTNEPLSLPNAEVRYHRIGGQDDEGNNLAFAALSARRHLDNPLKVQVYARLENFRDQPVTTFVRILVDEQVISTQEVTVPAAKTQGQGKARPGELDMNTSFPQPGDALITVRHDHRDLLDADNEAHTLLAPARRMSVLLVSTGNEFIERACRTAGVDRLVRMTPEQYENQDPKALRRGGWDSDGGDAAAGDTTANEGFDVLIFDRHSPSKPPLVNSLYFYGLPPLEGLGRRDSTYKPEEGNEYITQWERDSDLLRHVDLSDIPLRLPGRLVVPTDGKILAVGREGPVLAEVTREQVRHVVVSFDLFETRWPLDYSFPVFFKNAMPVLGLGGNTQESGIAYRTGDNAVVLNTAELETIEYQGPVTVTGRAIGTTLTLDAFARAGLYETDAEVAKRYQRLAVNLLDPSESDPYVAEKLKVGTSNVQGESEEVAVRKEIWPWFVWGALGLLLVEWVLYTRRMHI